MEGDGGGDTTGEKLVGTYCWSGDDVVRRDDVLRVDRCVGRERSESGGWRARGELADAFRGRRAAVVVAARVVDRAVEELHGILGFYGNLGANGNSTVLEEEREEVVALPELLDGVEDACQLGVVVAPRDSLAARGGEA